MAGTDYTSVSVTLTFSTAPSTMPVTFMATGDQAVENDETFSLSLSVTATDNVSPDTTATVTIQDNTGMSLICGAV